MALFNNFPPFTFIVGGGENMHFFKHGDKGAALAIVLPSKLQASSDIKEGDEFEFFELEKGAFVLISRKNLEEQVKKGAIAGLLKRGGGEGGAAEMKSKPDQPASLESIPASPEAALSGKGFAVIASEEDARRISKQFEREIKANDIVGVRGFDKKFYIVSAPYLKLNYPKIIRAIGSREMGIREISASAHMDEQGCNACLQVMKEQGDVIEKRRGVFKLIK